MSQKRRMNQPKAQVRIPASFHFRRHGRWEEKILESGLDFALTSDCTSTYSFTSLLRLAADFISASNAYVSRTAQVGKGMLLDERKIMLEGAENREILTHSPVQIDGMRLFSSAEEATGAADSLQWKQTS
jgi:hypothetical protein